MRLPTYLRRAALVVSVALATAIAVPTQYAFAATAAPPFNQCPQVGAAPSCQILLVINADRSITVLGDPNVGPYDGGDDTLVGIQNNSAGYVDAVTVTGPNSDLSGFDGDGLCTFLTLPACPMGPTGYEGPDTAFTVDASQPDSAEVDFTSGGLAPHGSTYFSLEGALTAAALTARPGRLGGYVALGDSYSSGEGTGDYAYNSQFTKNACHRSPHAYGPLLDSDRSLGTLTFVACSGAITADLIGPNHEHNIDINTGQPEAAQLDSLSSATKTVTLTIGGNDLGFVDVLQQCVIGRVGPLLASGHAGCSKDHGLADTVTRRLNALAGIGTATTPSGVRISSLLSLLLTAHTRAPNAHIYLAGYPQLFGKFSGECGIGTVYVKNAPVLGYVAAQAKITAPDAAYLNNVGAQLMLVIRDAVATAQVAGGVQVQAVDPNPYFGTHRFCDTSTSWLNKISGFGTYKGMTSIDPGSFHPTPDGQRKGYEAAFLAANIG
jgi:hypothetical protein